MYIIIAGCESVGASLVTQLAADGNDVAVIDRDEENFSRLGSGSNCMTVTGIPIDEDVLKEAGIGHADALAAVTPDDNTNIMVAQIARQLYGIQTVIVCASDPEKQQVLTKMGIQAICPVTLTVDSFFSKLKEGMEK